jgi:predicted HAD superfamily Cof-like phosphohydrolase
MLMADPAAIEFRLGFLAEELQELRVAFNEQDRVCAVDAMVDMTYVLFGTALMTGVDPSRWDECFSAVHAANMRKVRVRAVEESKRKSLWDVRKPAGWTGPEPEIRRVLGEP